MFLSIDLASLSFGTLSSLTKFLIKTIFVQIYLYTAVVPISLTPVLIYSSMSVLWNWMELDGTARNSLPPISYYQLVATC